METLKEKEIKIYAQGNKFLQLQDIEDLAELIQIPIKLTLEVIEQSDRGYFAFKIPKKKGGYRQIEAPGSSLKLIQSRVNYLINIVYYGMRPACVHGFVKSITEQHESFSITSNAAQHVKAQYVLNMDLKDFFHSIDMWRVKRLFMSYPFYFGNDLASYLALITTYQERLPMGAPTSPVVSNLACFLFDRRMMRFAQEQELHFTRYADDLTFSSNQKITGSMIEAIKDIIAAYRFEVNEDKTRLLSHQGKQLVTGLKVNEKVNVDRKYIRNIRAMLNNWATHGLVKASSQNESAFQFLNILKGKLDFLSMVRGKDDSVYWNLYQKFRTLQQQLT